MADPNLVSENTDPAVTEGGDWAGERTRNIARLMALVILPSIFVILAAVALVLFWPRMKTSVATTPTATAAAPVDKDAQITALQSQILTLQSQLLNRGAAPAVTPGVPVYAPDPAAVAQLSARLDRIEAQQRALSHAAAAAEAAETLRRTAASGSPFATELALVQPQLTNPHALDPLRPYADKGIPSEVSLVTQFPRVAARANIAAKSAAHDKGLFSKLTHTLGAFVSVRRIDNDGGAGFEATLARAEKRINAGDLSGAVAYLNTMPPAAQAAIKPWLDQARARVAIDSATRQISEAALSTLGQAGNEAAQPIAASGGGAQ